jgi:hypothetical protein
MDASVKGQYDSEAAWIAAKKMIPISNAPLVGKYLEELIKENTIKY